MRLARELPNLPEPKAQRVAHLSLRDALARAGADLEQSRHAAAAGPRRSVSRCPLAVAERGDGAVGGSCAASRVPTGLAAADAASTARSLSPEPLAGSGLVQTILEYVRAYKQDHPEVTDTDLFAALDEARRQILAGGVSAGPETRR